jgi:hypothetical protein
MPLNYGVPRHNKQLTQVCSWPFSAIEDIDFQANLITAFWPGLEPASMYGALAAVDPKAN